MNISKYVGIPYLENGRDPSEGLDCWGLVRVVLDERFGIDVPAYEEDPGRDERGHLIGDHALTDWQAVERNQIQPGDVLWFRIAGFPQHVGVVVDRIRMLHTLPGRNSVCERFRTSQWRERLIGAYRWKELDVDDAIPVTALALPYSQRKIQTPQPTGQTILDILVHLQIPPAVWRSLRIWVGGYAVPFDWWCRVRPKSQTDVLIKLIPAGNQGSADGKDTARALLVIGFQMGGLILGDSIGGIQGTIATALIGIGSILGANALIPPSPINEDDTGFILSAGQNRIRLYDTVPRVFGKHRVFPPHAARPFTEIVGNDQFIRMLFVLTHGPALITDIKFGDILIDQFADQADEETVANDRIPVSGIQSNVVEADGLTPDFEIYTTTVDELPLNIELRAGIFIQQTSLAKGSFLSFDLSFPDGLRNNTGFGNNDVTVQFQAQMRPDGTDTWLPMVPYIDRDLSRIRITFTDSGLLTDLGTAETNIQTAADALDTHTPSSERRIREQLRIPWTDRIGECQRAVTRWNAAAGSETTTQTNILASLTQIQTTVDGLVAGTVVPAYMSDIEDALNQIEASFTLTSILRQIRGETVVLNAYSPILIRWQHMTQATAPTYEALKANLFEVTDRRSGLTRRGASLPVPSGLYQVRIKRITADTDPSNNQVSDKSVWSALRSITKQIPVTAQNMTFLEIRVRASEAVNGVIDQVNCIVEAKLPTWDDVGQVFTDPVVTRNPAWAYLEVLRGAANTRPIPDSRIDKDEFKTWADENDAQGRTLDIVLNRPLTPLNTLNLIAAVGRATFFMRDTLFSIVRDIVQTTPVQIFTPRNSFGFKLTRGFFRLPHAIKARFVDENINYQSAEQIVFADGFDALTATEFDVITFQGITNPTQIFRMARYHLAVATLRPEQYEFSVDLENLAVERGDFVQLNHDVILVGLGRARVKSTTTGGGGGIDTVTVDDLFPMEAGKTYVIKMRFDDLTFFTQAVVTDPGEQTTLSFTAELPTGGTQLQTGDLVVFGETGLETIDMLIREIHPNNNLTARLVCVPLAPAVHNSETEPVPPFDPGITIPPVIQTIPPRKPVVNSVLSDETVLVRGADGTLESRIAVLVAPNQPGIDVPVATVQVQFRPSVTAERVDWTTIGHFQADGRTISVQPVEDGETYDVRLRNVTTGGIVSDWTLIEKHTVIGKTSPPPDIRTMWLEQQMLRWEYLNPPLDMDGFRIRLALGVTSNWDFAVPAHDENIRGNMLSLTQYANQTMTFFARAVDTTGNLSKTAARAVVNFGDPPGETFNTVETIDHHALGFPDTITNGAVDGASGDLEADSNTDGFWNVDDFAFWTIDSADFYVQDFLAMTYQTAYTPAASSVGGILEVEVVVVDGQGFILEYEVPYDLAELWPLDLADPIWPLDLSDAFWPQFTEFTPVSNLIILEDKVYQIRLRSQQGASQIMVTDFKVKARFPTVEEFIEDASIAASGGSRLSLAKTFKSIDSVLLALQDDGGTGFTLRIVDKNVTLGPLIEVLDITDVSVAGTIDAHVKGF